MPSIYGRQQLEDVVRGATILGSGGGGDVTIGRKLLEETLAVKPQVTFVDPEEVEDDALVAVISGMGSPVSTKKRGFDLEQCVVAFERLEQMVGRSIKYVTALETGGGNFIPPLYVAATKNLTVVNGDGVGRAIPEMYMTMFYLQNIPPSPFAMADLDGNAAALFIPDSVFCEQVGRAIVAQMGGVAGVANYVMTSQEARQTLIPGTYERARVVGETIRLAVGAGQDPVSAVVEKESGVEIIRGRISELRQDVKNAHDYGYQWIEGTGSYEGKKLKVVFKNENMFAEDESGRVSVVSPDLICVFHPNGDPLTNADLEEGMDVVCLGIPCHERWHTPEACALFTKTLTDLGYTGDYVPISQLHKQIV